MAVCAYSWDMRAIFVFDAVPDAESQGQPEGLAAAIDEIPELRLHRELRELLLRIATMAEARTPFVVSVDEAEGFVSPREAAEMLGCSRQLVSRMLAGGSFAGARRKGGSDASHWEIPTADVLHLKEQRERRRATLEAASRALDELGIPYE